MKELSIKEKAKAYDEAVERVRQLVSRCTNNIDRKTKIYRVEDIESIFPELTENEDEKIRKEIINFLELPHPQFVGKKNHEEWIAWLEKQCERSSWSEEDEVGLGDALWAVEIVKAIAKDENAKSNLRYVENWLKSLKERLKGE